MGRITALALCVAIACGFGTEAETTPNGANGANGAVGAPFAITNVRVFDGERVVAKGTVVVRDGRIAEVGPDVRVPQGISVVDGTGATLLPGLVDAHVHAFMPGALQQSLAFGVTTVLDMFADHAFAAGVRKEQDEGKGLDRADFRSAGTLVTAKGGHGTQFGVPIPTIAGPAEAQAFVDARIAEGSDYIKSVYDDGATYGISIPTISKETLKAVVAAAHARGKLAVTHIGAYQGARDAIEVGSDGLVHLFVGRRPEPDYGAFVASHGAFVIPTLTVLKSVSGTPGSEALTGDARMIPYLADDVLANMRAGFPARPGASTDYSAAVETVKLLRAAKVPILAGTDAPNPGTAFGVSLHRELELLVEAGLTPVEALVAATSAPAARFRLSDRGRIAAGLRADLLLVKGDPTTDILATRDLVGVWKLGVRFDRDAFRARVESAKSASKSPAAAATVPAAGSAGDFEGGQPTAPFGAGWQTSTDSIRGGTSKVEMAVVGGGANGSKGALEVTGRITSDFAFPWAGAIFYPGAAPMAPADLRPRTKLSFWAKGDGKSYRVMVFARSLGMRIAEQKFAAGPEWKRYTFAFSDFGVDGSDTMAVLFTGGPEAGPFAFRVDDVGFE
jgi:imidazolonepropionase-like amidohydrolase